MYVSPIWYVLIWKIVSWPKDICPGLFTLVLWYVACITKANSTRITIFWSESSTYVSCRLYVRTRFPNTWCILSPIVSVWVFSGGVGLVLIPYSYSINPFLNSWPRNSPPWSYVIYIGQGYLTRHVVSSKFAVFIAFLSKNF